MGFRVKVTQQITSHNHALGQRVTRCDQRHNLLLTLMSTLTFFSFALLSHDISAISI
ncbi:hypothetical protein PF010_g8558 [Phytophthora fragariae]|uniref:Uncharacterized protein n=1 Tax=Phytophthora fragariae TaxID=53985 RepID=A0A6A3KS96_9STRA|nr:hypothetical protein PF011_g10054 [Phytophthora fragariae]KAE9117572.1 hypothetical protein PF010_g8558 [Phytophthora fragariae]KAE9347606.1 hypothetical protein PF008_g7732 [Phytophthora fragariae]